MSCFFLVISFDHVGDQGGEVVIVANADLLSGYCVVLVDDRHGPVREQGMQCAASVQVAAAVGEVGAREQNLRHGAAIQAEDLLIHRHQAWLADGGEHLFGRQSARQLWKPEFFAPCRDGT